MRWQQALGKKGWLVYTWPKKHGGPGFTPAERYIFENVCAEEYAPGIIPFGTKMVGPVIYTFGNDEAEGGLPAIRESTVWWCQGYSEPGSGSDLASLRTKAEKAGRSLHRQRVEDLEHDGPLGRLDLLPGAHRIPKAKPQEGISFLLIDMKTPGITVKPIIMADGGHEVNEVFFDNVKVPVANLVGKENEAGPAPSSCWPTSGSASPPCRNPSARVAALKDIARAEREDGKPLIENQTFAEKIADLEIQVTALEFTELRVLSSMAHGGPARDRKCRASRCGAPEIQQRITELTMEAVGEYAAPHLPACCGRARTRAGRTVLRPSRRAALLQRAQDHDLRRQQKSRKASSARWCWGCDLRTAFISLPVIGEVVRSGAVYSATGRRGESLSRASSDSDVNRRHLACGLPPPPRMTGTSRSRGGHESHSFLSMTAGMK